MLNSRSEMICRFESCARRSYPFGVNGSMAVSKTEGKGSSPLEGVVAAYSNWQEARLESECNEKL